MDSPKYNRTMHVPWSPGASNDDKIATSIDNLIKTPIIITEKMDGSNTSLESEGCYARTHSGAPTHPSFDALKAFHATIKYKIPGGTQLFGEWCYARHSIDYGELPGYFLLFNVRYLNPIVPLWAPWEDVEMWAEEIGVPTVPVLLKSSAGSDRELENITNKLMNNPSLCGGIREGVVIRIQQGFSENNFSSCVMKCVRANHVQTTEHWKDQTIIRNKLKLPNAGT